MESAAETVRPSILLVEDTLTQAMLMQHQLKKAGYAVKLARSGKAALEELEKEAYGVILSDINMPGMDGFQLCKEVKSKDSWKNIPFILLATPVEKHEIIKMLESGADNFILKAYDEKNFLLKLEEIVLSTKLRKDTASPGKAIYADEEIESASVPQNIADFMISSFEMYLFQLGKSAPASESQ